MKSFIAIITALFLTASMQAATIYCKAIQCSEVVNVQVFDQDGNNVTGCVVVEASKNDTIYTGDNEFRLNVSPKTVNDRDEGNHYTVIITSTNKRTGEPMEKRVYIDAHKWMESIRFKLEMKESDAFAYYNSAEGVDFEYVDVENNLAWICETFSNINPTYYDHMAQMGYTPSEFPCECPMPTE